MKRIHLFIFVFILAISLVFAAGEGAGTNGSGQDGVGLGNLEAGLGNDSAGQEPIGYPRSAGRRWPAASCGSWPHSSGGRCGGCSPVAPSAH